MMGNQREVQRNFGKRASDYRHSSTHGNPIDLERMIKLIKPSLGSTALDVATGGGHTAIALSTYTKKVVAIDITLEMLVEAEEASGQQGINNIEFREEDVHNLNMMDNEFDIVASRFAIHHFSDAKKALQEMCRVLKPGGKLYIIDCSVIDGKESEKEINHIELLRDSSHQCSYSPDQWNELLKELPLTVEHTAFYKDQYQLPEWFERMGAEQDSREKVFHVLNNLSSSSKFQYPFNEDYITTYRIEILASKI